jgi:hypothetical protein
MMLVSEYRVCSRKGVCIVSMIKDLIISHKYL